MKLRDKKKFLAAEVVELIQQHKLIESVGGLKGPFLTAFYKMAAGENVPYSEDLNWVKIDFLYKFPEIKSRLDELDDLETKIKLYGWIPGF